jgi:hypothetical protein
LQKQTTFIIIYNYNCHVQSSGWSMSLWWWLIIHVVLCLQKEYMGKQITDIISKLDHIITKEITNTCKSWEQETFWFVIWGQYRTYETNILHQIFPQCKCSNKKKEHLVLYFHHLADITKMFFTINFLNNRCT